MTGSPDAQSPRASLVPVKAFICATETHQYPEKPMRANLRLRITLGGSRITAPKMIAATVQCILLPYNSQDFTA